MLVSVILPSYNGELFIRRAIRSVLSQDHHDLELLVVNDGSTDSTPAIVQEWTDPRIRLIHRSNGGVAAARNTGVAAARGGIVAFLDQDDEWLPHKLTVQIPALAGEGVAMVGSRMRYVDVDGRGLGVAGESTDGRQKDIAAAAFVPFPLSSAIARRDLVLAVGGFDEFLAKTVAPVDDLDLLSRLAQRGQILTVPETLGLYRIHGSSASVQKFFAMQTGTEFVKHRESARRAGRDLTWDQFKETHHRSLGRRRAEYIRYFYRTAAVSIAAGKTVTGAAYLVAAALLGPGYTVKRIRRQRGQR